MVGKKFNAIKNHKHKSFILNYVESGNGTRSYMRVYPSVQYSTARANANKLLTNTDISGAIEELFQEIWETRKHEIGRLFSNIIAVANTDIADIVEYEKGEMKIRDFSKVDTRAVQSVKHTVKETKYGHDIVSEVKLVDKTRVHDLAARILKMIDNKTEIVGDIVVKKAVRPDRKR